jgi:GAF domain-containing protein
LEEGLDRNEKYKFLLPQLKALIAGEDDTVAGTANVIAALKEAFSFFWIGIYFVKEKSGKEVLVLGPFQGPPACMRIEKGKGVCGTAWQKMETMVVPDVTKFPGHIACSTLSKSEIVIPVIRNNKVLAVLDVDSMQLNDFDLVDKRNLEEVADLISTLL